MKEKIIETAGKTWQVLGEEKEATIPQLSKILRERQEVVCQAIGWLAREDKINFTIKNKKTVVSLVQSELQEFQKLAQPALPLSKKTAANPRKYAGLCHS